MERKSKTKYSWRTSLPAYLENAEGKDMQEALILYVMRKLRSKTTLKEIQDYLRTRLRVILPQSTISGRMSDLRHKNKVAFFGDTRIYRDRIRKVFEIITIRNSKKKRQGKKIHYEKVYPVMCDINRLGTGTLKLSDGTTWITNSYGLNWRKNKKAKKNIRKKKRKPFIRPKAIYSKKQVPKRKK